MKIYRPKDDEIQDIIERDDALEISTPDASYHERESTTDPTEARKMILAKIDRRRKSLQRQLWALNELQRKIEQESGYSSTADGHGVS